jgi:SAM-dependent methyltransferase
VAPYERVPIFRASQDLVCFIHTLDHLEDPAAALAKAHKELRAGGRLLVVVHNMNAWTRHLLPTWPGTDRYHIHEFSPASLRQLAESAGFEVLWQGSTLNKYSLGYLLSWLFGIEPRGHWGPGIWVKLGNIGLVARKA